MASQAPLEIPIQTVPPKERGRVTGRGGHRASILTGGGELATGKPYVQRSDALPGLHDRIALALVRIFCRPVLNLLRNPTKALRVIVAATEQHAAAFRELTEAAIKDHARLLRYRLRRDGFTVGLVGECFALINEAAFRTLGYRYYPSQLMAGWGLLQGRLVEMATGEGKSLAATLPASVVALAGFPVHVVTVNDYLAKRDAEEMAPLYRMLGLTADFVVQDMEKADRRNAYAKSIVYTTNKDIAFDYLRDGVALDGRESSLHVSIDALRGHGASTVSLVLRGLYFAIVDEADSVFVDEARTPLILSASLGKVEGIAEADQALAIAAALQEQEDYIADLPARRLELTAQGKGRVAFLCSGQGGLWTSIRAREELIEQALGALHLFKRDQQYIVEDGKVQIVDESTGRVMPDRSWERGLHQLIEVKEGCEPTERRETLARLTYQRLFRRYVRLSGMTGTGKEVAREIQIIYGLDVVKIPLHRPLRRIYAKPLVCLTQAEKWRRVAESVEHYAIHQGRPVLVGTRSVGASEELSALLTARGIDHALLNARQDTEEAAIIAQAGQAGRVTVATNMAGRGTDIRPGPGIEAEGGLHVILTEYHDSRRVDRQLFGRCARQGDRGSCQAIVSLEDEIYTTYAPWLTRRIAGLKRRGVWVPQAALSALKWIAQRSAERRDVAARVANLKTDRRVDQLLAFSGRGE